MRVTVDLWWSDSVSDRDIAGYKIYWSGPRQAQKALTVQKDVSAMQLSVELKPKTFYTFAVAAFDVAGNESVKRTLKVVYIA